MKRDKQIVLDVLQAIESLPLNEEINDNQICSLIYSKGVRGEDLHGQVKSVMYMLHQAGFIEARSRTNGKDLVEIVAWRLTWSGAELLSPFLG